MDIVVTTNYAIPYIQGPFFSDMDWIEKTYQRLRASGFTHLDWCACDFCRYFTKPGETALVSEEWMHLGGQLREMAGRNGMDFRQAHDLIFDPFAGNEQTEFMLRMEARVFKVCKALGVGHLVVHPAAVGNADDSDRNKKIIAANAERFKYLSDLAYENDVLLCIENLASACSQPEIMLELLGTIDRDNVGVCLDVGHANLTGVSLYDACVKFGSSLKCMHIHDNDGYRDLHQMPLHGKVDWSALFDGLEAIHYVGDFTLEVHPVLKASERLRMHQEREAYMVCAELIRHRGRMADF